MCICSSAWHFLPAGRVEIKQRAAKTTIAAVAILAVSTVSGTAAQTPGSTYVSTVFKDGTNGAKVHIASGFVCPDKIGRYIRDAVGESDLTMGSDFCSYYALDGVYGTITLTPLQGGYNPTVSLAPAFIEQEGIGGRKIGEKTIALGSKNAPLPVYTRTYETARLETLHYRILFTGGAVKNWVVETTIEYAEPRDLAVKEDFLNAVYDAAQKEIGGQ